MTESSKVVGVREVSVKDSEKVLPQRKMHSDRNLVFMVQVWPSRCKNEAEVEGQAAAI